MLKQRVITAIVLLLGLIAATTQSTPFIFSILMLPVVLIAAWEWCALIGMENKSAKFTYVATITVTLLTLYFLLGVSPSAESIDLLWVWIVLGMGLLFWLVASILISGYPENKANWSDQSKIACMGLFALTPAWVGVVQLKYMMPSGLLILAVVVLVAAVDVGAYFAGINFGKRKLAPRLSPNKTWEGVWGGLVVCILINTLIAGMLREYYEVPNFWQFILLATSTILITFFSIIGDLLESMLKRNRGVKDSGSILPGHGGLLDRVDGLLAAIPVFVFIAYLVQSNQAL